MCFKNIQLLKTVSLNYNNNNSNYNYYENHLVIPRKGDGIEDDHIFDPKDKGQSL